MKDLSIPIPGFKDYDNAEIILKVGGKQIQFNFRVVSFPWDDDKDTIIYDDPVARSLARIYRLKEAIEGYDKQWELIQIFNPSEGTGHIQVLYRKRK